ncbi:isochorismatase family protein [Rhodobacterales bacterium HKCCE3408]|nr:isochorismatase family protein [Rhodobacterales bacterium HKCCE3408]
MEDAADIYHQQELGRTLGRGHRPALIVVDFVEGFLDPDMFGGGNIPEALEATLPVLEAARGAQIPIVFTRIVYAEDGSDRSLWCLKAPRLADLTESAPASQLRPELDRQPGEHVVRKRHASAFLGTDLAAWLTERHCDTLLIAGCTTSGCVRGTVMDGIGHGFRPMLLSDCTGDRATGPHDANLFDMQQKYADLMTGADAIRWLTGWNRDAPQDPQ